MRCANVFDKVFYFRTMYTSIDRNQVLFQIVHVFYISFQIFGKKRGTFHSEFKIGIGVFIWKHLFNVCGMVILHKRTLNSSESIILYSYNQGRFIVLYLMELIKARSKLAAYGFS